MIPLHVKVRGKAVKEVAEENPLSRGGHTHTHTWERTYESTGAREHTAENAGMRERTRMRARI